MIKIDAIINEDKMEDVKDALQELRNDNLTGDGLWHTDGI